MSANGRGVRPRHRHAGAARRLPGSPWRSRPAVGSTGRSTAPAATAARRARKASYVYDPGADSWTPIADAPVDTWASGAAVANGTLVVNGGVQGAVITNRTFAYDPVGRHLVRPAELQHRPLPRRRWRAGSTRSAVRRVDSRRRSTARRCPASRTAARPPADVEWLTVDPRRRRLRPASPSTVHVTMDPAVAQPGTYSAADRASARTRRGRSTPVDVTMTVNAAGGLGQAGRDGQRHARAPATVSPLAEATVQVDSWAGSWTFDTEADGRVRLLVQQPGPTPCR